MPGSALFTPLAIRSVEFRNRLWVSPMCQYSCEDRDGVPTDWHLVHLGSMARGGAGLVIAEATAVVPEGRITAWDTGLWSDAHAEAWSRIVRFIHSQGAAAGVQLQHAGRKASTYREWSGRGSMPDDDGGWATVGPSPLPFPGLSAPRELTATQIREIVEAFADAASRAVDAGFDVVDIHCAHGYLLHEFLSPLSNQRHDEYGGSLENRARLVREVTRAVRAAVGADLPVFVRVSATDWSEPEGWTVDQTVQLARWLADDGADLIDVSSGGNVMAPIPDGRNYQVPLAARVREEAGILTSAVGRIVDADQAEEILTSGKADAVMVAREFLRDPHFALRAAYELGVEGYGPPQYARGTWVDHP